jgi:hypothetical protein
MLLLVLIMTLSCSPVKYELILTSFWAVDLSFIGGSGANLKSSNDQKNSLFGNGWFRSNVTPMMTK